MFRKYKVIFTVAIVAVILGSMGGGYVLAKASLNPIDGNGVISAAYQKVNGMLRLVNGEENINPSEVFIQWNQVGQQGPQGEQGITGADGADGKDGAPGAQGLQGPQGDPGLQGPAGNDGREVLIITKTVWFDAEKLSESHTLYSMLEGTATQLEVMAVVRDEAHLFLNYYGQFGFHRRSSSMAPEKTTLQTQTEGWTKMWGVDTITDGNEVKVVVTYKGLYHVGPLQGNYKIIAKWFVAP